MATKLPSKHHNIETLKLALKWSYSSMGSCPKRYKKTILATK